MRLIPVDDHQIHMEWTEEELLTNIAVVKELKQIAIDTESLTSLTVINVTAKHVSKPDVAIAVFLGVTVPLDDPGMRLRASLVCGKEGVVVFLLTKMIKRLEQLLKDKQYYSE